MEASGFTREMQKTFDEALCEQDKDEVDDENNTGDEDVDSEAERDGQHDPQVQGSDTLLPNSSAEYKETVDLADSFADLMTQSTAMRPFWETNATVMEKRNTTVENMCSEEEDSCAACILSAADTNENDNETDTLDDGLIDLTNQNRAIKPFRDLPTVPADELCLMDKVSVSSLEAEPRTKLAVDMRVVKQKIKTQHQRQQEKLAARRTIKRGEAAVVTRARRHNNEVIQHRAGWDF